MRTDLNGACGFIFHSSCRNTETIHDLVSHEWVNLQVRLDYFVNDKHFGLFVEV